MPKWKYSKKLCNKCLKEIFSNAYNRHIKSCKGPVFRKKRIGWNKGLTAKMDSRVRKNGIALRGILVGRSVSKEVRLKISKSVKLAGTGGYRSGAGRGKHVKVVDSFGTVTTLQSSYEFRFSQILDNLKVNWIRPKAFNYEINGIKKKYYPDFFLTDYNRYFDTKNDYLIKIDKDKIKAVESQNGTPIYVLNNQDIEIDRVKGFLGLI